MSNRKAGECTISTTKDINFTDHQIRKSLKQRLDLSRSCVARCRKKGQIYDSRIVTAAFLNEHPPKSVKFESKRSTAESIFSSLVWGDNLKSVIAAAPITLNFK